MTKQITLEEALELVSFKHVPGWGWQVCAVDGSIYGDVSGNIWGNVGGFVGGNVKGDIGSDIGGNVYGTVYGGIQGDVEGGIRGYVGGTINGRKWESVETPSEKVQRWIDGASEEELLKLINQLEDN